MHRITVLTRLHYNHLNTDEFRLSYNVLKKALPENTEIINLQQYEDKKFPDIYREIKERVCTFVLILEEPSIYITHSNIKEMIEVLRTDKTLNCVLPSDWRGVRKGKVPYYFSLRGFEKFVASIYDEKERYCKYDKRKPIAFLIRKSVLEGMELPEDMLDIPLKMKAEEVVISLNAYIHSFIDIYNEERADVVGLIPAVNNLLDIGCARGRFGKNIKDKLRIPVYGVEMNPREAEEALKVLDGVYVGDIMSIDLNRKFACITGLEVVEHVVDTAGLLSRVGSLLEDNGFFIISIPNVGHWAVAEALIAGRWDYVSIGIQCITHLRFFTKASIIELFRENNFEVKQVIPQIAEMPTAIRLSYEAFEKAGGEVDFESLNAFGYYVVARKH